MTTAIAYPFVEVVINTAGLQPVAQRSPGVIAVVGKTPTGANGGTAAANTPTPIDEIKQAADLFARVNAGVVAETPLYRSLRTAFLQDPKPSKIYGVRVANDDYAAALASLEAADDVTFVGLAEEASVGVAAAGANPPTNLMALKAHVETMSSQGLKRIGVAMVDPNTAKSNTYVTDVVTTMTPLRSSVSRMVVVAARGGTGDAATAAMAAIAGYAPEVSTVLKRINGLTLPVQTQYGPSEIKGLSEQGIIPIIDPALIPGTSLHFAEGRLFTSDQSLAYIDIVRVLDDLDFRLKAGLIGLVGDARITKAGLTQLSTQIDGILGPLKRRAMIDNYTIDIPLLNILLVPEASRTPTENNLVTTARATRTVDAFIEVRYGPAIHLLKVTLAPKF